MQWRIQDFPDGRGAPNPKGRGGANLLFGQKFPENCMKKEIGYRGGGAGSANAMAPDQSALAAILFLTTRTPQFNNGRPYFKSRNQEIESFMNFLFR